MPETVEISKTAFNEMKKELHLLECLRGAGVDNWDGWDFALEEFHKEYPDE